MIWSPGDRTSQPIMSLGHIWGGFHCRGSLRAWNPQPGSERPNLKKNYLELTPSPKEEEEKKGRRRKGGGKKACCCVKKHWGFQSLKRKCLCPNTFFQSCLRSCFELGGGYLMAAGENCYTLASVVTIGSSDLFHFFQWQTHECASADRRVFTLTVSWNPEIFIWAISKSKFGWEIICVHFQSCSLGAWELRYSVYCPMCWWDWHQHQVLWGR